MSDSQCDIGVVGLGVIGKGLLFNLVTHGFRVAMFDWNSDRVTELVNSEEARGKPITACHSLAELVGCLRSPRIILFTIPVGDPIASVDAKLYPELAPLDASIAELCELLSPGDVIMDGGNSHHMDTERRMQCVERHGLFYVGVGISGGEEGARRGPSLMPGGSEAAWPLIRGVLQAIAARAGRDGAEICCDWIGPGGSGNFVKVIHNGIEYANMQLICEAYWILKQARALSNAELHEVFSRWNEGELSSYLIESTRDIFALRDPETGRDLVDLIVDQAGSNDTGKWMSQLAFDLGVPSTLVTSAVQARNLSAMKESRRRACRLFAGISTTFRGGRESLIEDVRQALFASIICSYAQGIVQLQAAAVAYRWPLDIESIVALWRGGCIIRAAVLDPIQAVLKDDPKIDNLLLSPYFSQAIKQAEPAWRRVVTLATRQGIPTPALSAALAYYDGLRSERLPANLLQALRDFFGRHGFDRWDKPGQGPFHIR